MEKMGKKSMEEVQDQIRREIQRTIPGTIQWKRKPVEREDKDRGCQYGIEEKQQKDLIYLSFPLLEETGLVQHLFTTRMGGISDGIFSSMNLSYSRGDEKSRVDENFRRIAALLERDVEDFVFTDQTHTTKVRHVGAGDRGKGILYPLDYKDIDGLITDDPSVVLVTFFADCVPLYFIDKKNRAIGLSHSGWRGTVGKMGACTLHAMEQAFGTKPEHVTAAIGPSICGSCYEVSEDVIQDFTDAFGDTKARCFFKEKGAGKYRLDLWKTNVWILQEAGVPADQIAVTDLCTCCNPDLLFSHRASMGKRGNLAAFLALKKECRRTGK